VLRTGATAAVLGHRVMAPSTLGTFLRAFTFGHVRQLDRLTEQLLTRAWAAGAGPGDGPMTIDLDSTVCEVHGHHKQGAAYGSTRQLGYHPLLASRADSGEVLHARQRTGSANTARGAARFVNELAGRIRRAGATGQLTLRADSGFWSAKMIGACQRHRIRCSMTVRQTQQVQAAIAAIGLGQTGPVVAKTLRRRLLTLPGRLTRSARRRTLHLPTAWPWAHAFIQALGRLRTIRPPDWAL
jgi:Transposase DDE domain group 1